MKIKKCNGKLYLILIIVFLIFSFTIQGEQNKREKEKIPHRIPKVTSKVKVDAVLSEAVWQEALKMELNYEVRPGENIKPPVRTEVLLAYSKTHLYIAFRAYDPQPSEIRATVHDRDRLGTDGWVAVILDPFNDSRRTYNFFCTPLGIQADMIESPDGGGGLWDAIWDSAGKIYDWGYAIEMAIPFSSLRFQRAKGDQIWGIDVVRSYPRSVRHHIGLFPRDRNNNCYMCQSEKLIGFSDVSVSKNLEITPTLSGHLTQERDGFPDGEFIKKDSKVEPGITARWGFTPNLTLSATVNPDFSNVEADVAQLEINKQFALFYPEKRPFFLEGASIFNTRYRAVYTRSLADPNGGIKLTGKEGPHAIGFFSVHDNLTNLLIPGSQSSISTAIGVNTIGSAFRYRRDIGKASSMGLVLSDREGGDYFNRVGGLDGNFRLTRKDRILFQFLSSQTQYPEDIVTKYQQPGGNFWGQAYDIFYTHITKTFHWYANYQEITPNFRADLGFITQVDFRNITAAVGRTWRHNPGFWYTLINLGTTYALEKDHDNNLLFKSNQVHFNYTGPVQSLFNLTVNIGRRGFMGMEFEENYILVNGGFQPTKTINFSFSAKYGDQIDITNIQPGNVLTIAPIFRLIFGTHLSLDFVHVYERLNVDAGRLYTANLSNLKMIYQFNKRTFLRTIFQYTDYKFNTALYPYSRNPKYKHLFSQILFSYKINPRTVLFIGYSDDHLGFQGIELTQNNRTAFVKIGYALRL
ncbi:MAG: carbohydrate binding family 9 domain-containing protein [Candidatus Aminicenantes bacterium]|nr:carbohydrate binding family 9 domain-containing protein [Candidatus Aminicenantes bacterium]